MTAPWTLCADPHAAALGFDQARAAMWHWRRDWADRKRAYRARWGRRLHSTHPTCAYDWRELALAHAMYRNARGCAQGWRAALRRRDTGES